MLNIKEIALRVAQAINLHYIVTGEMHTNDDWNIRFATALIAEIAKKNDPVAFANEELDWKGWKSECVVKLTRKRQSEYGFTIPLYTYPSTAEQIAILTQQRDLAVEALKSCGVNDGLNGPTQYFDEDLVERAIKESEAK